MMGELLSTGQAAQLCSVNADTVLKWIKRGLLRAERTAGGHYRIQRRDLAELIPVIAAKEASAGEAAESCERPLRCWEYLSRQGVVTAECSQCLIYQVRAAWCFRTAQMGCKVGQVINFSQTACQDCAYYRRAAGRPTRVLVVTADEQFALILRNGKNSNLELRFARNAYEASALIGAAQTGFAVVDQSLLDSESDLLTSLESDSRAPGLKIILAVSGTRRPRVTAAVEKAVVATLEKPFGVGRIAEVVDRFPVERIGVHRNSA